jgi:hypothetical protein
MRPAPVVYVFAASSSTSLRRPVMYTVAPLASSARVIMSPIPVPPPVTTAVTWEASKRVAALRWSVGAMTKVSFCIGGGGMCR